MYLRRRMNMEGSGDSTTAEPPTAVESDAQNIIEQLSPVHYPPSDRDICAQNHGNDLGWDKAATAWKKQDDRDDADVAAWPITQVTISHFDVAGNLDKIYLIMKSTEPKQLRVYSPG